MTLTAIRYILTVIREGSYSRAAEKLFISQPALSQCVAKLEAEMGLQLVTRSGNTVIPTPAGKVFIENAGEILEASQRLERRMRDINSQGTDELRIGISQFYGLHHLSRFLPVFNRTYPGIHVTVKEGLSSELESMVVRDELDIAFVPFPLVETSLEYTILYKEEIFLAVPADHPLSLSRSDREIRLSPYIDLSLVKNEPFIFLHKMRFTAQAYELCNEAGFWPNIIFETRSWDTAHELVRNGMGISFIPEILLPKTFSPDDPSYFALNSPKAFRPYAVIYRSEADLTETARNMIRIARGLFMSDARTKA